METGVQRATLQAQISLTRKMYRDRVPKNSRWLPKLLTENAWEEKLNPKVGLRITESNKTNNSLKSKDQEQSAPTSQKKDFRVHKSLDRVLQG